MYVTELSLNEFRGIRRCREPLRFTKFNVLLGRNNSGKSAVLQALSLLPYPHLRQPMDLASGGGELRLWLITHLIGGKDSLVYRYTGTASLHFKVGDKGGTFTVDEHGNIRADFAG